MYLSDFPQILQASIPEFHYDLKELQHEFRFLVLSKSLAEISTKSFSTDLHDVNGICYTNYLIIPVIVSD